MKVVYKVEETTKGVIINVENNLESLQKLVNGYIETVKTPIKNVVIVCNEEGLLKKMKPNFAILKYDKEWDEFYSDSMIVGPALFVGVKGADFRSLTQDEIKKVNAYIGFASSFLIK